MPINFQPFEMERMMSKWENVVEYNLSESGVFPLTMRELVTEDETLRQFLDTELNYPQANGILELRENISLLYPGSNAENVLVTVGCIEANYLAMQSLLTPGDEIAVMFPNYMQIWGVAVNSGLTVKPFHLREDNNWALELGDAVTDKTKMIAVCNPNNPTGYILTEKEMDDIIAAAEHTGAWLLADEVYAGAERLSDTFTPTFWGRYDKVLAMGSLSKAYGLPGLRLGWTVGPEETVDAMWARHEYLTISAAMLSNHLAAYALSPEVRSRLLQRAREYVRKGYPVLEEWMSAYGDTFSAVPPHAAAIAFVKYDLPVNSTELVERLMKEKSVLVVPGDHFGIDFHLRISHGLPHDFLKAGLSRIGELIAEF